MKNHCICFVLLSLPTCFGFSVGFHDDLTKDLLPEYGFNENAQLVIRAAAWFTDYRSVPLSVYLNLGSSSPFDSISHFHANSLTGADEVVHYFEKLRDNTQAQVALLQNRTTAIRDLLLALGATLHAVEDFYSHSNWVQLHPRNPVCNCLRMDTINSYTRAQMLGWGNKLLTGQAVLDRTSGRTPSLRGDQGKHGSGCSGMNHDTSMRSNFEEAFAFGYAGSAEWIDAFRSFVRPDVWARMLAFTMTPTEVSEAQRDLTNMYRLSSRMTSPVLSIGTSYRGMGSGDISEFMAVAKEVSQRGRTFLENAYREASRSTGYLGLISRDMYNFTSPTSAVWPIAPRYNRDDVAVTVRTLDAAAEGANMDMYVLLSIDGLEYHETSLRHKNSITNWYWSTTRFVSSSRIAAGAGRVNITYMLRDENWDSVDTTLPLSGASDGGLHMVYDPASHTLTGGIVTPGVHDTNTTRAVVQRGTTRVAFYVHSAHPCNLTGLSVFAVGENTPLGNDRAQCETKPALYFCTQSTVKRWITFLGSAFTPMLTAGSIIVAVMLAAMCCVCRWNRRQKEALAAQQLAESTNSSAWGSKEHEKKKRQQGRRASHVPAHKRPQARRSNPRVRFVGHRIINLVLVTLVVGTAGTIAFGLLSDQFVGVPELLVCTDNDFSGKLHMNLTHASGLDGGAALHTFAFNVLLNGYVISSKRADWASWQTSVGDMTWEVCVPAAGGDIELQVVATDTTPLGKVSWPLSTVSQEYVEGDYPLTSIDGVSALPLPASVHAAFKFYPSKTLAEITPNLKDGDVVLMSGVTLASNALQVLLNHVWSHVGLVYVRPDDDYGGVFEGSPLPASTPQDQRLYFTDSTLNLGQLKDCTSGAVNVGVQLVGLQDKLQNGWDKVGAVRHLILTNTTREYVHLSLAKTYKKYAGVAFQPFDADMMRSAFNLNVQNDYSSLFCSEYTALAYARAGVYTAPNGVVSNAIPTDFASEVGGNRLLEGARLSNEIFIRDIAPYGDKLFCDEVPGGCRCG